MPTDRYVCSRVVGRSAASIVVAIGLVVSLGLVVAACTDEPAPVPSEQPPPAAGTADTRGYIPSSPLVTEHRLIYTGANPAPNVYVLIYPVQRFGSFTLPPALGLPAPTWPEPPSACMWASDDDGVVPVAIGFSPQWADQGDASEATPFRATMWLGLEQSHGSPVAGYEILYQSGTRCFEPFEAGAIAAEFSGLRVDFHRYVYTYVRLPGYFAPGNDNSWAADLRLRIDSVEMAGHKFLLPERLDFQPYTSDRPPAFALVPGPA